MTISGFLIHSVERRSEEPALGNYLQWQTAMAHLERVAPRHPGASRRATSRRSCAGRSRRADLRKPLRMDRRRLGDPPFGRGACADSRDALRRADRRADRGQRGADCVRLDGRPVGEVFRAAQAWRIDLRPRRAGVRGSKTAAGIDRPRRRLGGSLALPRNVCPEVARRSGDDPLHLGHDGSPTRRDAEPAEPGVERGGDGRDARHGQRGDADQHLAV